MIIGIIIPFVSILLAEFGDKTQIAVLSMSVKYKNDFQLFFGVILAFILVDGFAIFFAKEIMKLIPINVIKFISGFIFIIFGIVGLFEKSKKEVDFNNFEFHKLMSKIKLEKINSIFLRAFFIVLFAEFGDKSQIASGVFATIYNPLLVFIGVILALMIITILTILFGRILFKKFNKEKIEKIANYTFVIIGVLTLFELIL